MAGDGPVAIADRFPSIESSDQVLREPFVFHNDRSRVFGTLLASAMLSNTLVRSMTVNGLFTFRVKRMCGRLLDAVEGGPR